MFATLLQFEAIDDNSFTAPPAPDKGERLFGGQFLAQCLAAAQATVAAERCVHSLHGYFLRPGDVDLPLRLIVEEIRDGRSFSARQVLAEQRGKERFRLLASFQIPDETPQHVNAVMPSVPAPEEVRYAYDDFMLAQTGQDAWCGAARPVDIRYVNPPSPSPGEPVTETQLMWMRIGEKLPEAPAIHQAALAYLSDATLVDSITLPLGRRWQEADSGGISLDHAMWFHRAARADDWLLFAQTVETTGDGRGLASGRFFTRQGALVATCLQEGLMGGTVPSVQPSQSKHAQCSDALPVDK